MAVDPERHDDNDDRVICRMDVEGMPQRGNVWNFLHRRQEQADTRPAAQSDQLTQSESRRYTSYSVLAGLLVVLVYTVTLVLFILFCTLIWFR